MGIAPILLFFLPNVCHSRAGGNLDPCVWDEADNLFYFNIIQRNKLIFPLYIFLYFSEI